MSTMQSHVKKTAAPGHQNGEDDDDDVVGALICMDIHLRKAEAVTGTAAAATKSKSNNEKSSTLAQQVCTPKISPDNNLSDKSSPQHNIVKKRRIEECTSKEDQPRKKVAKTKKHYRYSDSECLTDGCTNKVQQGGVCRIRHGAKKDRYKCSADGCTNGAVNGGVCIRHGAKV